MFISKVLKFYIDKTLSHFKYKTSPNSSQWVLWNFKRRWLRGVRGVEGACFYCFIIYQDHVMKCCLHANRSTGGRAGYIYHFLFKRVFSSNAHDYASLNFLDNFQVVYDDKKKSRLKHISCLT